jgi:hypothetical protein
MNLDITRAGRYTQQSDKIYPGSRNRSPNVTPLAGQGTG